jgi:hypothetical protein
LAGTIIGDVIGLAISFRSGIMTAEKIIECEDDIEKEV